jgi:hypothetical protein
MYGFHIMSARRVAPDRGSRPRANQMNADIYAFIAEVAAHPMFLAALKADPRYAGRLEKMEHDLRELYERGDGDADLIELLDAARRIVRSKHDMKERFRALLDVLIEFQARRGRKQ